MIDTSDISPSLGQLFSELVDGASTPGGAFILNSGDAGLLGSLDKLTAAQASRASEGGATIAAHAEHLYYGLSLMNRWASEGGDPFSDATWEAAWKTTAVDERVSHGSDPADRRACPRSPGGDLSVTAGRRTPGGLKITCAGFVDPAHVQLRVEIDPAQASRTFSARGPLGPWPVSNVTF